MFFGPHGEVCFVELKAEGSRMSEAQIAVMRHLIATSHGYLASSDYRDVIETLKAWACCGLESTCSDSCACRA